MMTPTAQPRPQHVKPEWARGLPDTTDNGDPIVYGPRPMAPRVTAVQPLDASRLRVTFETGETKHFDCSPYLDKGVFRALAEREAFSQVRVVEEGGGVGWDSGADLSRDTLYAKGTPVASPS